MRIVSVYGTIYFLKEDDRMERREKNLDVFCPSASLNVC